MTLPTCNWLFIKPWPFIAGTPVRVLNRLHVNKMGQTSTKIVSEKVNLQSL
jgi:hypothetical protein